MNHAVILAHPNPGSSNAAVASAYVECLKGLGLAVVLRGLHSIGFVYEPDFGARARV